MTLGKSHSRLVGVLVSAEVALTIVLLVGAGLLVRSAFRASQVEPGCNPDNLLTMTISLPANKFDWDHNAVFAREVIDSVRSLASISDAAVVHGIPMVAGDFSVAGGAIEGCAATGGAAAGASDAREQKKGSEICRDIPRYAGI